MAKEQKAEERQEFIYAEKVLNEEKKECHDTSSGKPEEDVETKKEETKKKDKKKKIPKTVEEEEALYKDIDKLKQRLEKIDRKIKVQLEKKAFFSQKLKEAEAEQGETCEKPDPKEVAAADGS
ncbi:hypothetical protein BT93_K1368 [Corymbia citriodora subsp. variegata]|nr:hypothetical protein BT93_K1368 [Corymbia citriodora subsp. variegata]